MKGARNRTADASGCRWVVGVVRARARSTVHRDRHQSSVFTFASSLHHTHTCISVFLLKNFLPQEPSVVPPFSRSRIPVLPAFRFRPSRLLSSSRSVSFPPLSGWPSLPSVSEGRIPDRPRSRVDTGRKSRHGLATEAGRAASASCWAGAELWRRAGPAGRSRCGLGCLLPGKFDC